MRKIFFAVMFVVAVTFSQTCAAQDVWVNSFEGTDVYVMDDTLRDVSNKNYKHFKISVKHVENGKLQRVVNWTYDNYTDVWRYEIEGIQLDHTNPVRPRDLVFEFCMNRLSWSYRIKGNDPIIKFYY